MAKLDHKNIDKDEIYFQSGVVRWHCFIYVAQNNVCWTISMLVPQKTWPCLLGLNYHSYWVNSQNQPHKLTLCVGPGILYEIKIHETDKNIASFKGEYLDNAC